jgi:sensor domain CHASE-containing protein
MTLGEKLLVVFLAFVALLVTVIAVAFRERKRGMNIASDDIAAQQQDARVMAVIFSAIMGGMLLTLLVAWLVFF